jgi:hypothetical protein
MQCRCAVFAAGSSVVAVFFLAFVSSVTAGPEKIKFPRYQTHVLYDVLDQPEFKEVRELFANPEALKDLKAGQPLPSGSVLSAPRPCWTTRANLSATPMAGWFAAVWTASSSWRNGPVGEPNIPTRFAMANGNMRPSKPTVLSGPAPTSRHALSATSPKLAMTSCPLCLSS